MLSTSDGEGFPNTFLQAWGSGTPVASLKIDPNHVIERLGLGAIHSNTDDLLREVRSLINAPTERDKIGARARQYVEAEHSEAAVVAQFESSIGTIRDASTSPVTLCEPPSPVSQ